MIKKKFVIVAICILITVGLSGCNEQKNKINNSPIDNTDFLGSWIGIFYPVSRLAFFSNNSCYQSIIMEEYPIGLWYNYELTNNKLSLISEGITIDYDYSLSNNGKNLTLLDGNGVKSNFIKEDSLEIIKVDEVIDSTITYFGKIITVEGYYNSTNNSIIDLNIEATDTTFSSLPISKTDLILKEGIIYLIKGILTGVESDLVFVVIEIIEK